MILRHLIGKFLFKSCPCCAKGDMYLERDWDGHRRVLVFICLQCGHTVPFKQMKHLKPFHLPAA